MGSDWIDCELGDLIELKRGYDLPKTKRVNGGVPVVSSSGSSGEHNEIKVKAPGVVTGRYGTIGEVFYIEDDFWPLNTTLYVKDFKGNDPLYVYYFLKTIRYSDYTDKGAVPGINRNHIHKAKVKVPVDPVHQRNLALKLFDLDKKIELNQKTNQTLEQMAQALFKSWFVDFDPVFDNLLASVDFKLENLETSLPDELKQKAQRRLAALNSLHNAAECKASLSALAHELQAQLPTKEATKKATQSAVQVSEKAAETPVKANLNANPNILAQHANTHAHFPNEFEHHEQLGWIPKGWNIRKLSSFSEILNGFAFKSGDYIESGNFVLRTKNFKGNEVKKATDDVYLPDEFMTSHNKYLSQPFDYHLVMVGASVGKCAIIYPHNLPALRNQNMWCFRTKKDSGVEQSFIKYMLDRLVSKSLGLASGSAREFFRKGDFGNQEVCIGTNNIQNLFHVLCGEYLDKMSKNSAQVEVLTKLRDTLLPKLISGELQIPDVAIG
ncbi:restriction endonuclease subunit S [Pseudoalteromonas sp. MIP2626]|uniref:restriction endonuclease subunit S n=1 Tax=Pseudoalteromonas sp. MIP2626 TaxID=2705464 RepID=UPI0015C7E54F|nr:restriction endonuclease subunit S [Pseudoalteromonas sp. MIP2626]NYR12006.1 restriction endonuclease subunit S [Pseudoalteromonas sp. MIP2626]